MSWEISRRGDQYRIWSTYSSEWLTDWISRKEAIKEYYDDALLSFKKKIIEQFYRFPHMWTNYDSNNLNRIDDEEGHRRWREWNILLASKNDPDEYVRLIDETYEQIIKAIADKEAQK